MRKIVLTWIFLAATAFAQPATPVATPKTSACAFGVNWMQQHPPVITYWVPWVLIEGQYVAQTPWMRSQVTQLNVPAFLVPDTFRFSPPPNVPFFLTACEIHDLCSDPSNIVVCATPTPTNTYTATASPSPTFTATPSRTPTLPRPTPPVVI